MEDLQAIHRLKRGDIGGLEVIVARYQTKAVETAFLITQDLALAEDIVQDVFVNLFRRIRHYDVNRPFKPYLMKSVVNAALDAVEKEAKWVHTVMDEDTSNLEELIAKAASVEDQIEFAQLRGAIDTAIAALPARQRSAIVQRYYLQMSEKEMAQALEAPPGTIKWLLNTARTRLRTLLGSERSAE